MGEAGNTSDQEFLLKEEKLLLWVSFLPFLWGVYIALTAINKCSTLSCGRNRWWKHRWCGKKIGISLLLGYFLLTRIIAQGLYWVSATRISGRVNEKEPIQGYFPCIEIKLQFLKCPFQSFVRGTLFYLDQLTENIVGIFKMFCLLFIWSVLALTLQMLVNRGSCFCFSASYSVLDLPGCLSFME